MSSSHPAFLSAENISKKVRFTPCTLAERKLNKSSVAESGRRRGRVQSAAQGGDQLMLRYRRTGGHCLGEVYWKPQLRLDRKCSCRETQVISDRLGEGELLGIWPELMTHLC